MKLHMHKMFGVINKGKGSKILGFTPDDVSDTSNIKNFPGDFHEEHDFVGNEDTREDREGK